METPVLFATLDICASSPDVTAAGLPESACQAEFALLTAIVEQALEDATERIAGVPSLVARQALCWFFSPSLERFSFNWICERFLVCPQVAQDAVMRRVAAAAKNGERLRRSINGPPLAASDTSQ